MTSIQSSVSPPIPSFSPARKALQASGAVSASRNSSAAAVDNPEPASERTAIGARQIGTASISSGQQGDIAKLAARDREVRAHEAAHAGAGGIYAGAPRYSYQRGPDGNLYAVGGEVSIDVSPVPGDPQATIVKAQLVRRAALAPAEPSSQDRVIASRALAMEQNARQELLRMQSSNAGGADIAAQSGENNRISSAGIGAYQQGDVSRPDGTILDTMA